MLPSLQPKTVSNQHHSKPAASNQPPHQATNSPGLPKSLSHPDERFLKAAYAIAHAAASILENPSRKNNKGCGGV